MHVGFPRGLSSRPPSRAAFTLIELLAVIAVIGILAAILIPVVGKVRESARSAQCVGLLRSLGYAVEIFAQENNRFPSHSGPNHGAGWEWLFQLNEVMERKYEGFGASGGGDTAFFCPQAVHMRLADAQIGAGTGASLAPNAYILTGFFNLRPAGQRERRPEMIRDPSQMAMFGDSRFGGNGWRSVISPLYDGAHKPQGVHSGRANILFLDHSVRAIPEEEIPMDADHPFWGRTLPD